MHHGRFVLEGTLDELRRTSGRETLVDMFIQFARAGEGATGLPAPDAKAHRGGFDPAAGGGAK
jgi:hypothetical protein